MKLPATPQFAVDINHFECNSCSKDFFFHFNCIFIVSPHQLHNLVSNAMFIALWIGIYVFYI